MPLTSETESIIFDNNIYAGNSSDLEKFLIYTWEGHSQKHGGNWKISVPLSVVSRRPLELPLESRSKKQLPRITLGKPVPPEPPIIMGGGVPVLGLTAGSKVDRVTGKRSDEYKLLRSQPLPAQERHEYFTYPEDFQNVRRSNLGGEIYHSYLSLCWQYLGLQEHLLSCLNNLNSVCVAHYLPPEMLRQSLYPSGGKRQRLRFSSALRHRMEAFISRGRIAFLLGNLRAVAMQAGLITGHTLSEHEISEMENFQAFEELAALDRGLPVLYVYPFYNIYEMERVHSGHTNVHSKEIRYVQPLSELRCLLEPGPLQQKLEQHANPSL